MTAWADGSPSLQKFPVVSPLVSFRALRSRPVFQQTAFPPLLFPFYTLVSLIPPSVSTPLILLSSS